MPFPFRFQKLNAAQVGHIQRRLEAGASPQELAGLYRVSLRTIQRARHRAAEPVVQIAIAHWHASFAVRDDGPVQVEPWRPRMEVLD